VFAVEGEEDGEGNGDGGEVEEEVGGAERERGPEKLGGKRARENGEGEKVGGAKKVKGAGGKGGEGGEIDSGACAGGVYICTIMHGGGFLGAFRGKGVQIS
jgi:hypothetical protein